MARPTSLDSFNALLKELKTAKLLPVYALFGEESFFLDKLQEAAIASIPEEARDFNLDVLYGDDTTPEKIIDICKSYPMMAEKRAVIVRDFMKLFDKSAAHAAEKEDQEDDHFRESRTGPETLLTYLDQPSPSTLLVLISEKKPAGNTILGRAFKTSKKMRVQNFDPVNESRLAPWIMQWAAGRHELRFDDQAAELLGYHVGNNLQQLTAEIEKLASFVRQERMVTTEDVKAVVGLSREFSIFDFSDLLLDRQAEKAMFVGRQILLRSDNPAGEVIKMINFLYTTFSRVWIIARLAQKGYETNKIMGAAGAKNTFYYQKLKHAERNYPLAMLPQVFEALLDADKAIKGFSKENPEGILMITLKKLTS